MTVMREQIDGLIMELVRERPEGVGMAEVVAEFEARWPDAISHCTLQSRSCARLERLYNEGTLDRVTGTSTYSTRPRRIYKLRRGSDDAD